MKLKFNFNAAIKKKINKSPEKVVKENLEIIYSTKNNFEPEPRILNEVNEATKDNYSDVENLNKVSLNFEGIINESENNSLTDGIVKEIKISSSQFEQTQATDKVNIDTCSFKPELNETKALPLKMKFNFKNAVNKNLSSKALQKKEINDSTETNDQIESESNVTPNESEGNNLVMVVNVNEKQEENQDENQEDNRALSDTAEQKETVTNSEPLRELKSYLPPVVPFLDARKSLAFNEIVQLMQGESQGKGLISAIKNAPSTSNSLIKKMIIRKSCINPNGTPSGTAQRHFTVDNSSTESGSNKEINANQREDSDAEIVPGLMETVINAQFARQRSDQSIFQLSDAGDADRTETSSKGTIGTALECSLERYSSIERSTGVTRDHTANQVEARQETPIKSRKAGHIIKKLKGDNDDSDSLCSPKGNSGSSSSSRKCAPRKPIATKERRKSSPGMPDGARGSETNNHDSAHGSGEGELKLRKSPRLSKKSIDMSDNHTKSPDSTNVTLESPQSPNVTPEHSQSPYVILEQLHSPYVILEQLQSPKVASELLQQTPECPATTDQSINPLSPPAVTTKMKFNWKNAVNKSTVAVVPPKPFTEIQINLSDICIASQSNAIVPFVTNPSLPLFKSPDKTNKIARRIASPSTQSETDDNLSTHSSCVSRVSSADLHSNSASGRKRNRKSFVLKRHSAIQNGDERDVSQLTLIELINNDPQLPPPQSRLKERPNKRARNPNQNMAIEGIATSTSTGSSCSDLQKSVVKTNSKNFRIDLNGEIVIDDDDDETKVQFDTEGMEEIVENAADLKSTYRSYIKRRLSGKRWNAEETGNFYKALLAVKTDFTRMSTIFKGRSRADLQKKFKVEEKLNSNLIYLILASPVACDISNLVLDSHLNPPPRPPKCKKPRKDAAKSNLRCSSQSDSDADSVRPKPKRSRRKINPKLAKVDPSASDLPDYLKIIAKIKE